MNHYQEEYVFAKAISFKMDRNVAVIGLGSMLVGLINTLHSISR